MLSYECTLLHCHIDSQAQGRGKRKVYDCQVSTRAMYVVLLCMHVFAAVSSAHGMLIY